MYQLGEGNAVGALRKPLELSYIFCNNEETIMRKMLLFGVCSLAAMGLAGGMASYQDVSWSWTQFVYGAAGIFSLLTVISSWKNSNIASEAGSSPHRLSTTLIVIAALLAGRAPLIKDGLDYSERYMQEKGSALVEYMESHGWIPSVSWTHNNTEDEVK